MDRYTGYAGKILWIDLTGERIWEEEVDKELAESFLGGNGFGAKILYENMAPNTDPLGEKNLLIFMTGPGQGTSLPALGSRTAVITKSPLTNLFMDSYFGGAFGAELKYAGYDGLVIEGKAERPSIIKIEDDKVEIVDADDVWGMNTLEAQMELKMKYGHDRSTVCIGRAGEKMVKLSCILSGVHAAGRGGTGAVMGSKNLKALVVKGSKGVSVHNPQEYEDYRKGIMARFMENPVTGKILSDYGTPVVVESVNKMGILGTKNWQSEYYEEAEKIGGDEFRELAVKSMACISCPMDCAKMNHVKNGKYTNTISSGPEYETIWSLGSNLLNSDKNNLVKADRICDEYGIDTISAGAVIGLAMELYEREMITIEETGKDLRFGDKDLIISLLEDIGNNRGFGRILGEGSTYIGKKYDAERYTYNVKGLDIPAHSPRGYMGMALGYATSNRGGSHQDGRSTGERAGLVDRTEIEGKGAYIAEVQRMTTLADCIVACRFTEAIFSPLGISNDWVDIIYQITGMKLSVKELNDISDRVYVMERLFNIREGATKEDDTLPYRTLNEPIPYGPSKGQYFPKEKFEKELGMYYEYRGWDPDTGTPRLSTIKKLGLDGYIDDIRGVDFN